MKILDLDPMFSKKSYLIARIREFIITLFTWIRPRPLSPYQLTISSPTRPPATPIQAEHNLSQTLITSKFSLIISLSLPFPQFESTVSDHHWQPNPRRPDSVQIQSDQVIREKEVGHDRAAAAVEAPLARGPNLDPTRADFSHGLRGGERKEKGKEKKKKENERKIKLILTI